MFCECFLVMNKYIKFFCFLLVNVKVVDLCSFKSVCLYCILILLLNIFLIIYNFVFWFSIIENILFRMLLVIFLDRRRNLAVVFRVMGVDFCLVFGIKVRVLIIIGLRDLVFYVKSKFVILV